MQQVKQLWLPFLIMLSTCCLFSLFLPFFPVDETRYLGVAWEMRLNDSFIVPLQNALPYSHKPPLLFWLINLDWALLGMNEATLRFIPLLFGLFNVYLVFRIALLLWEDEKTARHAALILASTLSYLLWSSFIMFDVVLACWVLLAVCGFIAEAKRHSVKRVLLSGLAIGAGILTKGPVILVYVLPVALFAFLWIPRERFSGRWYAWLGLSVAVGAVMLFLRSGTLADSVRYTAGASFVLCAAVIMGGNSFFHRYDLHGISEAVRARQSEGYQVIHQGKYHGQFHFVGKLQQPLVALDDKKQIAQYAATHEKVALITYERETSIIEPGEIFFRQPFRSKQVVLWNKSGIARLMKEAGTAPADAAITDSN